MLFFNAVQICSSSMFFVLNQNLLKLPIKNSHLLFTYCLLKLRVKLWYIFCYFLEKSLFVSLLANKRDASTNFLIHIISTELLIYNTKLIVHEYVYLCPGLYSWSNRWQKLRRQSGAVEWTSRLPGIYTDI